MIALRARAFYVAASGASAPPINWQTGPAVRENVYVSPARKRLLMISSRRTDTSKTSVGHCSSCGADLVVGDRFCVGCGMPVPDAVEAELLVDLRQVTLGEYDIIGILGRGGMGAVYLAHELALNRKVAIKVLLPSLLRGTSVVERFRREAQIAASLRHRHITSIFGLKETNRLHFFVMDYIEGTTLESIILDEGPLDPELTMAVLHDVASALSYAHRREVTHRDIKPGNIIIDTEGMAVVTDFGVARIGKTTGLTTTGGAVGSPRYMSPEQWSGKATSLSDQYALGIVTYEMLSGEIPFDADTLEELMKKQLFGTPRHIGSLVPRCPRELASAVMRMLQTDPAKRWDSWEELVAGARVGIPGEVVRGRLAELARRGRMIQTLPKTPHSPIPLSRVAPARELAVRVAPILRRLAPWAAAAAVIFMAGLGIVRFVGGPDAGAENRVTPAASDQSGGDEASARTDDGGEGATGEQAAQTTPVQVEPPVQVELPVQAEPITAPQTQTTQPKPLNTLRPAAPQTGILQIMVTPWANVWIDNVSYGQMSRSVNTLRAGRHMLRFVKDGFVTVDTLVTLRPGSRQLLRVQMRPRNQ